MKVSLNLKSDNYILPSVESKIDFEDCNENGDKADSVCITLGERKVTVSRDELKRAIALL